MKIERLTGTAERLYFLVAPLVMDPEVLKQNNGYPFKTSRDYIWFVGVDDGDVVRGFLPVEIRRGNVVINNYYVEEGQERLLLSLIEAAWKEFGLVYAVRAVVQTRHVRLFEEMGFRVTREWTLYKKMQRLNVTREEKCL